MLPHFALTLLWAVEAAMCLWVSKKESPFFFQLTKQLCGCIYSDRAAALTDIPGVVPKSHELFAQFSHAHP